MEDNKQQATTEEKVAQAEPKTETKTVSKELFDRKMSELAEIKRQLNARMTEEEIVNQEHENTKKELEMLKKQMKRTETINGLVSKGISHESAKAITDSLYSTEGEGANIVDVIGNVFNAQSQAYAQEIEKLKLGSITKPQGGQVGGELTGDVFKKMNIDEKIALKQNNPDLFNSLHK